MPETLLRTKLHPPFTRRELVDRPRLKQQITQGLRGPLTLIAAPAGFGKTTLIASYAGASIMPLAWLSLDKDDNQLGRFLTYLVAAVQEVDQTIGKEAAQLLAAASPAPTEAIVTSLINDLDAAGELALVLDDYQFISNPAVHEQVAFLLEHCPTTCHLLIATRADPLLPLSRLRARGQMVELRAADLRFTEQEAAQFLNEVMGFRLDEGSVAMLEERTEGWAAGLQMAAVSMRDREDLRGFIAGFSGTNRYILDYLLEEVLANQPPEIQHFLFCTSILERLTAALCDALLETQEMPERVDQKVPPLKSRAHRQAASILAYLERLNLFLVPLDEERMWYRYHHLFADLLRARLQQAEPDLVPRLHRRASAWLEQNGFLIAAVHHLLAARETARAAQLIERYGPARLAEGDPSVLQMADHLPQKMVLERPKIGLYRAWLLITQGRIAEVMPLLHKLAEQLAAHETKSEQPWMQAFISAALAFLAPPSMTAEPYPLPDYQLLEAIPDAEPILRNAADFLFGMALGRRGKLDHAVAVSLQSIHREKQSYWAQDIPTLAPFLSRIYLIQGRLQAAVALCREFLDPIKKREVRFVHTAGSMKIDLGEALYEWNRLQEAERHIRDGLQDNELWQNIMTDGFGLVALTRVLQAQGDYAGALRTAEKFEKRLLAHSQPREFAVALRTLRVRVQLASGDLHGPSHWADQVMQSEDYQRNEQLYRLTLGRIRLAQGRSAAAEQLLMGLAPVAGTGSRIASQVEIFLLLAATVAAQQRRLEALPLVESALALAEPEGYMRIFLDVGEPARDLLVAYLRSGAPGQEIYAQKVVDTFAHTGHDRPPVPQTAGLIETLTARELEVLKLMAQGRTNKEIAQQLVVAPGTVKAHSASIYRKLDVANRTAAVAHARRLGILP